MRELLISGFAITGVLFGGSGSCSDNAFAITGALFGGCGSCATNVSVFDSGSGAVSGSCVSSNITSFTKSVTVCEI